MAQNRPRTRRSTTRRTTRPEGTRTPTVATTVAQVEVRPPEVVDWRTEYAYVFRDLRQLGMVSVTIFALLLIAGWLV